MCNKKSAGDGRSQDALIPALLSVVYLWREMFARLSSLLFSFCKYCSDTIGVSAEDAVNIQARCSSQYTDVEAFRCDMPHREQHARQGRKGGTAVL